MLVVPVQAHREANAPGAGDLRFAILPPTLKPADVSFYVAAVFRGEAAPDGWSASNFVAIAPR